MQAHEQSLNDQESKERKVHVTVRYTLTASKKEIVPSVDETVQAVINEAYKELKEARRAGDQYFCADTSPRLDLSPYLTLTLEALKEQGLCVHKEHNKLVFVLDIDAETGGAAQ